MDIENLQSFIAEDPLLRVLHANVSSLLEADDDPGHDLRHALRVAVWTIRLGGDAVDRRHAIVAALFHDVVNLPKSSSERAEASTRSAEVAREALAEAEVDEAEIALITEAIRDHSYSRGRVPETPLGKALQDADRLEALGAIGVFRTVSCGTRMGAVYFHPDDPFGRSGRALDDRRFTVDHFFEKLLRLPDTMQTAAGRDEAQRRVEFMRGFLRQLGEELGETF